MGHFNGDEVKREMTSKSSISKFDPADHAGNVYDAFTEFAASFDYEYEALGRAAPAGTADPGGWLELDKRRILLGRCASRNLQKDFEAETTAAERSTITFTQTIAKLKARYLPTRNTTLANYQFHRLRQEDMETFDIFVNRVKQEASNCSFKCNDACTVQDTLIRDQVIIGTTDTEIRKKALGEQWQLPDLITNRRRMEAASVGSKQIKIEVKQEEGSVSRVKPGKYIRKNRKASSTKQCSNCSNKACKGGDKCVA